MANSGQAGRRPSNTALMTAVIERSLYVKWHVYDRSAGKDYFDCYAQAVAGHCTFLKVGMDSEQFQLDLCITSKWITFLFYSTIR